MRRAIPALSIASLIAFAPACDTSEDDSPDSFFRNNLDVNVQMTMADGGDDDGSILWELVDTEVFLGSAQQQDLLLFVVDDTIWLAANGIPTCTINAPFLNSNMVEVVEPNTSVVLFTIWNNYVFEGEVDVAIENYGHMKRKFGDQLLFEYQDNDIYFGEAKDGQLLVTTDADLTAQSQGRQLLIAALMTGDCGGSGLPGYNF